jgi:hypothetical protein
MDIPDYYRKFNKQPPTKDISSLKPDQTSKPSQVKPPQGIYRADKFTINIYEDWHDKTIYTITGPVTHGIQHNIVINIEPDIEIDSLDHYVDWQVSSLEEQLKACRLLLKEKITLNNGIPAYRAVFSWYPTDDLRVYQEQIYLLHEKNAYKLTASFTKKTRKTIGPQVERMMLSFSPLQNSNSPPTE